MQSLNINLAKVDKSALIKGEKGTYMNLVLFENREGPDQYGYDGFIKQDLGKDRRQAGESGPIIGNWKHIQTKASAAPARQQAPVTAPVADDDDSEIPF